MPLTFTEKLDSRKWVTGDSPSVELVYMLTGTSDDVSAKTLATNSTATTYEGLVRQSIEVQPEWVDTTRTDGRWIVTVRYGLKTPPTVGQVRIKFSTMGGTQHVTQSRQTIHKYAPTGKTAPDFKGAIGVTHDAVEGVDIAAPVFKFQVSKIFAASGAPSLGDLYSLTAKVNNATFTVTDTVTGRSITLAAGECLFEGAQDGGDREDGAIELQFDFAGGPNRTGITVGDITGIAKKGWESLWVRYADSEDAAAKSIVKRPVAAYVEELFESGDFSALRLSA
jgi:hypothetical protein